MEGEKTEFTEMEWRYEPMIGLYEAGIVDFDQVIEKLGSLKGDKQARFGFGEMVVLGNGNRVHKMQIRAETPDRVEIYEAGFSPSCKHRFFKSLPEVRKWLMKWEKANQ